jgi:hypothetical protein
MIYTFQMMKFTLKRHKDKAGGIETKKRMKSHFYQRTIRFRKTVNQSISPITPSHAYSLLILPHSRSRPIPLFREELLALHPLSKGITSP